MNFFIGAFYDGVYLLGMVLNETISDGEDIRNGLAITKRMWSRDFHGKQLCVMIGGVKGERQTVGICAYAYKNGSIDELINSV